MYVHIKPRSKDHFLPVDGMNVKKNMNAENLSAFHSSGMDCDGECKLWPGMGDISES